jgi:hypothetical protein
MILINSPLRRTATGFSQTRRDAVSFNRRNRLMGSSGAAALTAPFGFAYVSGGVGDEWTMRESMAAFDCWVINADFISGVGSADTSTTILGSKISHPVITALMGNQGSQADIPNVKGAAAISAEAPGYFRSSPRPDAGSGANAIMIGRPSQSRGKKWI